MRMIELILYWGISVMTRCRAFAMWDKGTIEIQNKHGGVGSEHLDAGVTHGQLCYEDSGGQKQSMGGNGKGAGILGRGLGSFKYLNPEVLWSRGG